MLKYVWLLLAGVLILPHHPVAQEQQFIDQFKRALLPSRAVGQVAIASDSAMPSVVVQLEFAHDSSTIPPEARRHLDALGTAISESEALRGFIYRVEGHTSSRGNSHYNKRLSHQRAQVVADYLIKHFDLQREQFKVVGYGEDRPIALNTTAEGRQKNRRVAIVNTLERFNRSERDGFGVDVQVKYVRGGSIAELADRATLTQRDGYAVEFTPGDHAYVYACQVDATGNIDQLFPNTKFAADTNPTDPDRLYRIPGFGKWLYLDDHKGMEHIVVIAHRQELPEAVTLCQTALNQDVRGRGVGGIREQPKQPDVRHRQSGAGAAVDLKPLFVWRRSFLHQ